MKEVTPTTWPVGEQLFWKSTGKYVGRLVHFVCPAPGSQRMRLRVRSFCSNREYVFYTDSFVRLA